jgi:hypothetical protein
MEIVDLNDGYGIGASVAASRSDMYSSFWLPVELLVILRRCLGGRRDTLLSQRITGLDF